MFDWRNKCKLYEYLFDVMNVCLMSWILVCHFECLLDVVNVYQTSCLFFLYIMYWCHECLHKVMIVKFTAWRHDYSPNFIDVPGLNTWRQNDVMHVTRLFVRRWRFVVFQIPKKKQISCFVFYSRYSLNDYDMFLFVCLWSNLSAK